MVLVWCSSLMKLLYVGTSFISLAVSLQRSWWWGCADSGKDIDFKISNWSVWDPYVIFPEIQIFYLYEINMCVIYANDSCDIFIWYLWHLHMIFVTSSYDICNMLIWLLWDHEIQMWSLEILIKLMFPRSECDLCEILLQYLCDLDVIVMRSGCDILWDPDIISRIMLLGPPGCWTTMQTLTSGFTGRNVHCFCRPVGCLIWSYAVRQYGVVECSLME